MNAKIKQQEIKNEIKMIGLLDQIKYEQTFGLPDCSILENFKFKEEDSILIIGDDSYGGSCVIDYLSIFKFKEITLNISKELFIQKTLDKKFQNFEWINIKTIENSQKRQIPFKNDFDYIIIANNMIIGDEINKYKEFLNPEGVLIDINNERYLKLEEING